MFKIPISFFNASISNKTLDCIIKKERKALRLSSFSFSEVVWLKQKNLKLQSQLLKIIDHYQEVIKLKLKSNKNTPEFIANTYKFLADLKKIELSIKK